ncbi:C4-dicarboxylate ABC transporter substrate-binding protein [Synergistales bacterium]|nr:C4-dicarboxylate ABC transporter substrate-binding protein [Synergistales bacterium]
MSMKKRTTAVFLSLICILALASGGNAADYPKFDNVKSSVGTGTVGGGQYVYMGGVAQCVNRNVPGLELIMEATSGSGGNLALLQSRELGIASIESAIASNGMNGIGLAEGQKPFPEVRALFSSLPTHFGIWTLDPNITDITQLAGKRVAVGPYNGSTDISSRNVFKFLGIECEIIHLGWGDCFVALGEGRLDAVTGSSIHPAPGILELETKQKINFVSFTKAQIDALTKQFPYYKVVTIPASVYGSLEKDYVTVGAWQGVYTHEDEDEDLIYAITKAVIENLNILEATHSGGKTTRLENIGEQPIPLHKGAYRYYLEKGAAVPPELLPTGTK